MAVRDTGAVRREEVPLPHGFGVVFDTDTRFVSPEILFGGSPPRVLRLNAGGARALAELRSGKVDRKSVV